MNGLVSYEQNAEEMKMVESVACPKPRRLTALNSSLNNNNNNNQSQSELGASELLDLILNKGERSMMQLGSSPPFFSGSPPSRASNPVIQDERFGMSCKAASPFSPKAGHNGGCVRMKSGDKAAAAVRIEGFDCLSRDRRNCSIPSVA